jgi:hypothetical protein
MKIDSITVIYFYCSYQDAQRKSFLSLARAMLAQLLKHEPTLLSYLYESCVGSGQVSLVSTQLCAEILETCLKTTSKVYIIVDGIDECDPSERKSLLSFFTSLIERDDLPGKIRALFVSQDENDIRKLLRTASVLRLTDSHNKSDIESYATQWSSKIQEKFRLPNETTKYITSAVSDGSDGMLHHPETQFCLLILSRDVPVCKACLDELACPNHPRAVVQGASARYFPQRL